MAKLSKRVKAFKEKVDPAKNYPVAEAVAILNELSSVKFKESIDVSVNLGVDPRKSDQVVRGATVLPNGTGKTVRVAVFAQGEKATEATEAGADVVGMEDLAAEVKAGNLNFDVVIATPDTMRIVGQLGQVLGPRGLMPNPKTGTVTDNVAKAVEEFKSGMIEYRTDKFGNVQIPIGKASFEDSALLENFNAVIDEIHRVKPSSAKGRYIKKAVVSSTMGPGVKIDEGSI